MFGQNDDNQQQPQDGQNLFGQPMTSDNGFGGTPAPGAPIGPLSDDTSAPTDVPVSSPAADFNAPEITEHASKDVPSDDLLEIKQDALHELTPLVGHLEQSPEEKFRTTMMMIQASDDHGLIKAAYDSAKQITDEKTRAQALLDVVNEINYFTQQHNS